MKRTRLFATLSMALACSATFAQSELEVLRARCAEQERQIRQLEDENSQLRSTGSEAPAAAQPVPAISSDSVYVVKAGDSWKKIASQTGVSAAKITKLNGLKADAMIHPGQKLKLPAAAAPASAAEVAAAPVAGGSGKTHKIEQGDTFSSISRKYGISTAALIAANPTVKPSKLRLGQMISLGDAAPAATAEPVVQASPEAAPATPAPAAAAVETPAVVEAPPVRSGKPVAVMIEGEITYGDFAAKHGTDIERLNSLNGLDLTTGTVLAKGSELYVPGE